MMESFISHLDDCMSDNISCPQDCEAVFTTFQQAKAHYKICPNTKVICPHCEDEFPRSMMNDHFVTHFDELKIMMENQQKLSDSKSDKFKKEIIELQ
jgi:hypothetical protein